MDTDPFPPPAVSEGFDAGTYGRSFADVYDSWYPMDRDTSDTVGYLVGLLEGSSRGEGDDPGGPTRRHRVLETGVGTGRLAIPLARAGCRVTGMDSSHEMLVRLAEKTAGTGVAIDTTQGDASDPGSWPDGRFDLVVAAFNFVFNLIGDDAKTAFLGAARNALDTGGRLVVESFVPVDGRHDTHDPRGVHVERHLEVKEVTFGSVVLIASETDHSTGVVVGQHVELRDGEPVRLRPWRVHVVTPEHLDTLARRAGLVLAERHGDWDGSPFGAGSYRSVSVYRRA